MITGVTWSVPWPVEEALGQERQKKSQYQMKHFKNKFII